MNMPTSRSRYRSTLLVRVAALFLVGIAPLTSGCFGGPAKTQERDVELREVQRDYRAVYLLRPGGSDSNRHVGYMTRALMVRGDEEVSAFRVYNRRYAPVGFFFDDGSTYVYEGVEPKQVGIFDRDRALEFLLEKKGTFVISDVETRPKS